MSLELKDFARLVSYPTASQRSRRAKVCYFAGVMFKFMRKRFVGSYLALSAASLS